MFAADNWCVKVEDRVYGPYSSQQLRKFAQQGRLAAWSLVAPAGSRTWREVRDEATLAAFFGLDAHSLARKARAFGKRVEDECDGENLDANGAAARPRREVRSSSQPGLANFIIIFDVVNAAASRVETAVMSLGPAFRVAENVWAVSCELTAIGVRNAISPYLLPRESILVVDATHGRTSWQNYVPEVHAKLAAAWAATKSLN
ncbi:MAG TPA: GYF domain-containing protein [Parvularculaceae bacterium]|nr:GYF domain-containing protein [Parvularculaceae bacterium]